MEPLLQVKDLVVDYGIVRAINGISLSVPKGSIVAILGANGAGKSTTIRTINGLVKPKSGQIILDGEDITSIPPYKIAAKGMIQSPEGRLVLRGLTVEDNLLVGGYTLKSKKETLEMMEEIFTYFPVLRERRYQQASTLSGGEQQMLAIGRALMAKPKLLLLDEPSLGLAPLIVKDIFEIIHKLRQAGKTILIVEQNAYQTLKIADYVYVLELGKIKQSGKACDLIKDESLIKAYLGG